ncbi:S-4TM family putative pore-forming effector [Streptomyces sp900105755]|uniref:S-4TM family putative pore-forming effector n=1 Tax=Streptomyces sp. 900105755 TaxID=3154389 RepID=A0ABV1TWP4_9ACTN
MASSTVDGHQPIPRRQDEDEFVKLRAAARTTYDTADRIRMVQSLSTIALAIAAPVLALFWPKASNILAITAAVWLIAGRTWIKSLHRRQHLQGVKYQELYDVGLFGLAWNTAVAGPRRQIREEANATRWKVIDKDRGWYENVPDVPWPLDALACQVQNLIWSRRNHRAYTRILWTALGVLCAAAAGIWAAKGFSIDDFLVKVFVPLAPALLDLSELPRQHRDAAQAREQLEESIDDLWQQHAAGHLVTTADCREIQDSIFELRASNPPVPTWVHTYLHQGVRGANAARMEDIHQEITRPSGS